MLLRRLGGRIADIDPAATAFATRDAQHMLLLAGARTDPADDPTPHRDWVRGAWEAVRPWARGTYVNHLGDEGTARLREAYPPATWRRLAALKRRMDPANVFGHNQNIPPRA